MSQVRALAAAWFIFYTILGFSTRLDLQILTQAEVFPRGEGIKCMSSPLNGYHALDEPQKRGQATEAILKAVFVTRDIPVLSPEYDNEPFDFVLKVDGRFYSIQAKTAYQIKEGTVRFETVSTRSRSDGYDRTGYGDEIDCFAVFNPKLEEIYIIPVNEAASGKMEIRYRRPENNQQSGVNWHGDFLLDNQLPEMRRGELL